MSNKKDYYRVGQEVSFMHPLDGSLNLDLLKGTIIKIDGNLVVIKPNKEYPFGHEIIYRHINELL